MKVSYPLLANCLLLVSLLLSESALALPDANALSAATTESGGFVVLFSTAKSESDAALVAKSIEASSRQRVTHYGNYVVSEPYQSIAVARLRVIPGATVVGVSKGDANLIFEQLSKDIPINPTAAPPVSTDSSVANSIKNTAKSACAEGLLPAIFTAKGRFIQKCVKVDREFYLEVISGEAK